MYVSVCGPPDYSLTVQTRTRQKQKLQSNKRRTTKKKNWEQNGDAPAACVRWQTRISGSGKRKERRKEVKKNPKWKGNDFHFLYQPDTTRRRRDRQKRKIENESVDCGATKENKKKTISRNVKILICAKKVCHHGSNTMHRNCMAFASIACSDLILFAIQFFFSFLFALLKIRILLFGGNATAILLDL